MARRRNHRAWAEGRNRRQIRLNRSRNQMKTKRRGCQSRHPVAEAHCQTMAACRVTGSGWAHCHHPTVAVETVGRDAAA
jgi:hypothetical protein